jgi:hypothetical protein
LSSLVSISFRIIIIQLTDGIPNSPLNSTDRITHESQKVDIQAANSQPAVREASEQMESRRGSQSIRCKTRLAENSEPSTFLGGRERFGMMSKGIARLFVSWRCSLFIPKSSLRPLNGRIAHHPERFP